VGTSFESAAISATAILEPRVVLKVVSAVPESGR
jgi:hypothetical protein